MEINTYEELCFYIYNNTVLISKSSLSEKLFDWIRDELDMPELAAKLVALSNKATFAQDLLVEILNAGDTIHRTRLQLMWKHGRNIVG